MNDRRNYLTRKGKIGEDNKVAEYQHWDSLGDTERFRVAWELVEQAFLMRGQDLNELRFQRSAENLQRTAG